QVVADSQQHKIRHSRLRGSGDEFFNLVISTGLLMFDAAAISDHPFEGSRTMLEAKIKQQLQTYMTKVTQPFTIVASVDDGAKSHELLALLGEIEHMSGHITLRTDGTDARVPSFALERPDGSL